LAEACRELDLAVVSGNVSFYNESPEGPIHPTPIVGMLGVLPDVSRCVTAAFQEAGDAILLVGQPASSLGGSEYLSVLHGREAGRPAALDMELERRLQQAVRELIRVGRIRSAHDCAEGGLAVTLAECCIAGRMGAEIRLAQPPCAEQLFGEAPSRIVLTTAAEECELVRQFLENAGVPVTVLGQVAADALVIEGVLSLPVPALEDVWEHTLPEAMGA
jgi:phosphoribosylformylglycinamidine synthase